MSRLSLYEINGVKMTDPEPTNLEATQWSRMIVFDTRDGELELVLYSKTREAILSSQRIGGHDD